MEANTPTDSAAPKLNKVIFSTLVPFCDFDTVKNCFTLNKQFNSIIGEWGNDSQFWRGLTLEKFPNMYDISSIGRFAEYGMDGPRWLKKLAKISRCGIPCHRLAGKSKTDLIESKIKDWKTTLEVLCIRDHLETVLKDETFSGGCSEGDNPIFTFILHCPSINGDNWDIDDFTNALNIAYLESQPMEKTFFDEMEEMHQSWGKDQTIDEYYAHNELWKLKSWFEKNGVTGVRSYMLAGEEDLGDLPYVGLGVYKQHLVGFLSTVAWT
mmetsp:Transcript_23375/g.26516  ORF Transcript_23375/g.26516 Transcript_23375/m.26516 type:complete len:267 (+) Transcript_23375:62-862(+)